MFGKLETSLTYTRELGDVGEVGNFTYLYPRAGGCWGSWKLPLFIPASDPPEHLREQVLTWQSAICRNYKFHSKEDLYFVSFATVGWIDVFTRLRYKEILLKV